MSTQMGWFIREAFARALAQFFSPYMRVIAQGSRPRVRKLTGWDGEFRLQVDENGRARPVQYNNLRDPYERRPSHGKHGRKRGGCVRSHGGHLTIAPAAA
jgi:hypothetical protein